LHVFRPVSEVLSKIRIFMLGWLVAVNGSSILGQILKLVGSVVKVFLMRSH